MFDKIIDKIKNSQNLNDLWKVYNEVREKQEQMINKPASFAKLEGLIWNIKDKVKTLSIWTKCEKQETLTITFSTSLK